MRLTSYEKETVINYNDGEGDASIYTHNKALCRKLDKLSADRPDECRLIRTSHEEQAAEYYVPKAWIKVTPPRVSTEAQRAAARTAHQKARSML